MTLEKKNKIERMYNWPIVKIERRARKGGEKTKSMKRMTRPRESKTSTNGCDGIRLVSSSVFTRFAFFHYMWRSLVTTVYIIVWCGAHREHQPRFFFTSATQVNLSWRG